MSRPKKGDVIERDGKRFLVLQVENILSRYTGPSDVSKKNVQPSRVRTEGYCMALKEIKTPRMLSTEEAQALARKAMKLWH